MDPLTFFARKFFSKTNADQYLFGEETSDKVPLFEERFCPNCGSNKVEPHHDYGKTVGVLLFNLDEWKCRECDYIGIMPTRADKGENKIDFQNKAQGRKHYSIEGLEKYLYQATVMILLVLAGYFWIIVPLL